jgi:regulatory protein
MPIITSVKPQKNGKRLNIYLDGQFGFGIDLENFVKGELKMDKHLTDEEVIKIVKKAEFQKTFDKIVRFATVRPRSEKEITDWLKRKKVHESLHEELFNRLKHLELLDDAKFAVWWIDQRTTFRPKGKRALESELMQKGVNREVIKEVLSDSPIDEEKMARGLMEKNAYKWKNLPKLEAKQKKIRFLASKGFNWDLIEKLVD